MKKPLLLTLLAACAAFLFTGCGSDAYLTGMAVELAGIDRSTGGATATLRYVNPNTVVYNIKKSTHKVFLNGQLVATIQVNDPVGVPAQNAITQQVPLPVTGPLAAGEAAYRIESSYELRLFGDSMQDGKSASSGTVVVK